MCVASTNLRFVTQCGAMKCNMKTIKIKNIMMTEFVCLTRERYRLQKMRWFSYIEKEYHSIKKVVWNFLCM